VNTATPEDIDKLVTAHLKDVANLVAAKVAYLQGELADHEKSFELRHSADMRAIKRWQEAHPGNELVWPDHADLCVWLLGRVTQLEKSLEQIADRENKDGGISGYARSMARDALTR